MFAELRQILDGTWAHPACPIMFEGLPGTGKTAALNASFDIARKLDVRVGSARCDAAESSTPFEAVRQVFASFSGYAAVLNEPANDETDLARSVLRNGLDPAHDPVDVYHSLLSLLDSFGDAPVMIGIDDVQWADPVSFGWIQFLSRRLHTRSLHLVLTMRTTGGAALSAGGPFVVSPATRRFVMHPLSVAATQSMIGGHLGLPCDEVAGFMEPVVAYLTQHPH